MPTFIVHTKVGFESVQMVEAASQSDAIVAVEGDGRFRDLLESLSCRPDEFTSHRVSEIDPSSIPMEPGQCVTISALTMDVPGKP